MKHPISTVTPKSRGTFAYTPDTLRLVWRSAPGLTGLVAGLTLAAALLPLGVAWAGKAIVDAVVAKSKDATFTWVMVELGFAVAVDPRRTWGGPPVAADA